MTRWCSSHTRGTGTRSTHESGSKYNHSMRSTRECPQTRCVRLVSRNPPVSSPCNMFAWMLPMAGMCSGVVDVYVLMHITHSVSSYNRFVMLDTMLQDEMMQVMLNLRNQMLKGESIKARLKMAVTPTNLTGNLDISSNSYYYYHQYVITTIVTIKNTQKEEEEVMRRKQNQKGKDTIIPTTKKRRNPTSSSISNMEPPRLVLHQRYKKNCIFVPWQQPKLSITLLTRWAVWLKRAE